MSKEKKFDAVKFMREARERISHDIKDMTFEEEKEYYEIHSQWARTTHKKKPIILEIFDKLFPKDSKASVKKFWFF